MFLSVYYFYLQRSQVCHATLALGCHVSVILIAYKLNKKITAYVFHNIDQFREGRIDNDEKK